MEKVENLYRTARAQNDSIDTSDTLEHACATRFRALVKFARRCCARRSCGKIGGSGSVLPARYAAVEASEQSAPTGWLSALQGAGGGDHRIVVVAGYEEFRRGIFRILRRPGPCPSLVR